MDKNDFILYLYSLPQTVFTLKEVSLLFPKISYVNLRSRLSYFAEKGKLKRLRMGIYAKIEYNPFELANKLYTPSYISLETVLQRAGVVFQYDETIHLISYISKRIQVGDISIVYRKVSKKILLNNEGVEEREGYFMATKERAFLDAVYLYKDYHFDNLGSLDWEIIHEMKYLYMSKTFEKRVEEYYQLYKSEYA